jgi:hypothetical protein
MVVPAAASFPTKQIRQISAISGLDVLSIEKCFVAVGRPIHSLPGVGNRIIVGEQTG